MRPEESPTSSFRQVAAETALVAMGVLLVLMPWLFISSPHYREAGVLVFGVAAGCLGWWIPDLRRAARDNRVKWVAGSLLVAQAASLIGGLRHGEPAGEALTGGFSGIIGALGLGVLAWVLLQPRWRPWARRTFVAVTLILVVSSLLGFLVFTQWQLDLSRVNIHVDPRRLSLVFPTRLLSGELGRQYWDHANTAAFLFAVAWVVVVNALFHRPRFAWVGWVLALMLGAAVFLTASRSAWVMVLVALPPLLAFRGWRFPLQVAALLGLAGILGFAGLEFRDGNATETPVGGQTTAPAEIQFNTLIERGSAGRLSTYQHLWDDLEGDRVFGQGLGVTRTPVFLLLHEHSSYLAALRSGGITALAAQLVLTGFALLTALQLARNGCRWPLLLVVAVFSGLLFDRSTVFRLTGFEEFPAFWLAVWIPLGMRIR